MAVCTVGDLVDALWRNRLIDLPLLEELADRTRAPAGSPVVLARQLVARGRLTRFQADECLAGRGASLALGPYRFLDLLGHGALGRVYRARHGETGEVVAVKVIHAGVLSGPEQQHRFHREAEAAARLRHPNLVAVLDDGVERHTHYLVMQHVEGVNLGRFLEAAGPLEVPLACKLTRQAALALQHASERWLVPDDVRPSDLIVTGDGVSLMVLLAGQGSIGRSGQGLGEFEFGSLLQAGRADGRPSPLEFEVDAFGEDVRAAMASLAAVFDLMTRGNTGATRRPELPTGLGAVLERMAATDPHDCFPTFAECADALAPFAGAKAQTRSVELTDRVVLGDDRHGDQGAADRPEEPTLRDVRTTGRVDRSRWWKPWPAAVLLFLAGVVAGLAVMKWAPDSSPDVATPPPPGRPLAPAVAHADDSPVVEREADAVPDQEPSPAPIAQEDREPEQRRLVPARAEAEYTWQLEVGERDLKNGRFDDAIARFGEAIALRPDRARPYLLRAEAYLGREATREAIADCDAAIGLAPDNALAYRLRGAARARRNDQDGAIADATRAIALRSDDALAYNDRGLAHLARGEMREAVDDLTRAVQIDNTLGTTLGNLAWILATSNDPTIRDGARAVAHATRACELTGWRDPVLLKDLAASYAACGRFDRAAEFQDRALEHAVRLPQAEVVQYRRMLDTFRARGSAVPPWDARAAQALMGFGAPARLAVRPVRQPGRPEPLPPPPVPWPAPDLDVTPAPRSTVIYRSNLHYSR